MNIPSMSMAEAKNVYANYVSFAKTQLDAVGGNINKADAVAVFSTAENGAVTVSASQNDYIHKLVRSSDLKSANKLAHEKFTAAVYTLLGGENNINPNVRRALDSMSAPERPLSARRIALISRDVDLALARSVNGPQSDSWIKDEMDSLGNTINNRLRDRRWFGEQETMGELKTFINGTLDKFSFSFEGVSHPKLDVWRNAVRACISDARGGVDLQTRVNQLESRLSNELVMDLAKDKDFKTGSKNREAAHAMLEVVRQLPRQLRLIGAVDVRANIAGLRDLDADVRLDDDIGGEVYPAVRTHLESCEEKLEHALEVNDADTVKQLLSETAPDFVKRVHNELAKSLSDIVQKEQTYFSDTLQEAGLQPPSKQDVRDFISEQEIKCWKRASGQIENNRSVELSKDEIENAFDLKFTSKLQEQAGLKVEKLMADFVAAKNKALDDLDVVKDEFRQIDIDAKPFINREATALDGIKDKLLQSLREKDRTIDLESLTSTLRKFGRLVEECTTKVAQRADAALNPNKYQSMGVKFANLEVDSNEYMVKYYNLED